jgi:hypothetical protein
MKGRRSLVFGFDVDYRCFIVEHAKRSGSGRSSLFDVVILKMGAPFIACIVVSNPLM